MSVAGIAGLFFGVLGWTQRGTGLVAPQVAAPSATSAPASAPASAPGTGSPSAAASPSAASAAAAGPQLSAMPYGSYAYLVWPGPVSATGKIALSGWKITVTRQPGGITVRAVQNGQLMSSVSHYYPGGAKVYVLDSDLGDDAGPSTDYNDTDDGLAVTNARGQVLG